MRTNRPQEIAKLIEHFGGVSALAGLLRVTPQAVTQWDNVPVRHVLAIERATKGKYDRHQMRPDVYGRRAPTPRARQV